MTTGVADDMLLDTHPLTPPSLPISASSVCSVASGIPSVLPADDETAAPSTSSDDNDVSMSSIAVPDEAALAAAAAAMAAAAQSHQDVPSDSIDGADHLNSYLLAAAAASVHAQQQRDDNLQHKATSEDSFDSTTDRVPNSVYTNGTSINGSDEDDTRLAAIHEQCRKYTDDTSPYPLSIAKRAPDHSQLPSTEATVDLGKTRCYWALLSADYCRGNGPTGDKLDFVYLDPILQQHMAEQAPPMIGSNFYDYVHPEERDRVRDDMQKIVESRTLFGSVTRCRYSRIPRIRELLGAINPPRDPDADRYVEDDSFVAIDIVINWIGDGMLLCFLHAIIDKGNEDNDEEHKSEWTNWCGTPGGSFTARQCDTIWKQVKATPRETVPETGPAHVFQVIEAAGEGRVLMSWPPPRLFPNDAEADLVTQSDTTVFHDGSYFADDFARLAQGVSIAPGPSSSSDANTSCTRRFRAKHTLTTEGKIRSIESVLIPYGGVILACFHTTFQQQLPPPDPKLVLQARATLQAQTERRKAEEDVSQASPNKRPRIEGGNDDVKAPCEAADGNVASKAAHNDATAVSQPKVAQSTTSATPSTTKSQLSAAALITNGTPTQLPAQKVSVGYNNARLGPTKHAKTSIKSEGLSALANPSLMYTNAPATPKLPTITTAAAPRPTHTTPANTNKVHPAPSPSSGGADSPNNGVNKACTGCGKINSPEWRRGPSGHKTLCNACGLRYARSLTRRKKKKGKDGEVEFIEPTGDPSIVPKSRGGGGGSLPGVHRKNSKKRKDEEMAKAAAAAAVTAGQAATTPSTMTPTPTVGRVNSTPGPSSTASSTPVSATQSPSPAVKSASPAAKTAPSQDIAHAAAATNVKVEPPFDPIPVTSNTTAISDHVGAPATETTDTSSSTDPAPDPSHNIAVSIALDAIAATSTAPSLIDISEPLPLPVSNAISRAIAATIGSTTTDGATANDLRTPHPLPTAADTSDTGGVPEMPTGSPEQEELDPNVSAAALQTIESVVSEALYKQLVHSNLPDTPPSTMGLDKAEVVAVTESVEAGGSDAGLDLTEALTADAIRAAAQAAVAHGVGTVTDEPLAEI
ncbi:uncharacterized protein MEPE_01013 [Melanopsichium pennsylvanicum]|uniref:GATA-type domain-containing protein n=2 Tax=Melanopsichium pennsylvanicum TaxID=63383 RepID=A0AAJ5C379_9BASI|nr:uncharacterized protein BN887_00509 [Melanopsichium pennsylvanicum 4]SNX82307.1 uncharacterized protein MEPE_01013 [Melanopsichium pennsylvanicum]